MAREQSGNPMDEAHVYLLFQGYSKFAKSQGLRPQAAKPWQQEDVTELLTTMRALASDRTGMNLICLLRDGFAFAVMWETQSRGINAGAWRWSQLKLKTGDSLWAKLFPSLQLEPGTRLLMFPSHTKTGAKDGPMHMDYRGDVICPFVWLRDLLLASHLCGHPIVDFITRPLNSSGTGFEEASMSSSLLGKRLHKYQAQASLTSGKRVHGFRRGVMQHRHAQGQSMEQVMQRSQMRTPSICRRYLDPNAHL